MIKVLSNSLVMINLNVLKGLSIALKEVDGLDGSGNPFGSSLPFPAGFNMASFPVSTSNSKSILPVNSNSFPILGVSFSFLNPKTKQTATQIGFLSTTQHDPDKEKRNDRRYHHRKLRSENY